MTSVSVAGMKRRMSGEAKSSTAAEMTAQKPSTSANERRIPARMRSGCRAPKFCATNVEKALLKSCAGIYANDSIFTAAANAAMTISPNEFTSPWIISMPKFITDCCTQVSEESEKISRRRAASKRSSSLFGSRSGQRRSVKTASPSPEKYCAMTVAHAAPATPHEKTSTNSRSSATLPSAEMPEKTSGVMLLPTERRRQAKKL